jgi:CDP-paratose 2-epimerase
VTRGEIVATRVLVTGGAGFVGASAALWLKITHPDWQVTAFDNLRRRGSELALARLAAGGVRFLHGDVRSREDLAEAGPADWLVECSAEPSVHAGYGSSPDYVVATNLNGAINCLEQLRRHGGAMMFISSSRVYPIARLRALPLEAAAERLELKQGAAGEGWSAAGIAESFPLDGARSLYGATKLAAELMILEYSALYGIPAVVNRCGVICGPWQMGKVDQGFVGLWLARHVFGGRLAYIGYGGAGTQVRDLLHVHDLCRLIDLQMGAGARYQGRKHPKDQASKEIEVASSRKEPNVKGEPSDTEEGGGRLDEKGSAPEDHDGSQQPQRAHKQGESPRRGGPHLFRDKSHRPENGDGKERAYEPSAAADGRPCRPSQQRHAPLVEGKLLAKDPGFAEDRDDIGQPCPLAQHIGHADRRLRGPEAPHIGDGLVQRPQCEKQELTKRGGENYPCDRVTARDSYQRGWRTGPHDLRLGKSRVYGGTLSRCI